jgi:hypothetical protein
MRASRFALVAVVAVAVAGLVVAFGGTDDPRAADLGRVPLPAAQADGVVSLTWYCAASTALTPAPPAHTVVVTNPTDDPVTARLTPYAPEGAGEAVEVEVPAGGPLVVDVAQRFGSPSRSVMVESPEGQVVVAHELAVDTGAESVPCVTGTSGEWWFPTLSTVRGAGAQLTLFNPFPADAGVDVEVVLDAGIRVPTSLAGIVVPAGTARVVDLGQSVQRRDQFAAVVRTRSGRVVAEVTQSFDGTAGPRGLRMYTGVAAPAGRWAFAGGFTGDGVAEGLVLVNPGEERITALVQVTPYGGSASAPEPLEVEVPGFRYVVVDLSAESRIPGEGYHSILVDSPDRPLVAARTTTITAAPAAAPADPAASRPALSSGVAVGTGTPVAASDWIVPSLQPSASPAPVVLVHNPNDGIAVVSTSTVAGGSSSGLDGAQVEVAPGDSVAVAVPVVDGVEAVALRISSMSPVVVEQLPTFPARGDLSLNLAVPVRSDRRDVVPLTGG